MSLYPDRTPGTWPAATALVAFAAWRWLDTERDVLPFLATIALFLLGYLGLLISNFPYLVPPSLTIWQTAAAPATHVFFLMGTLVMLPIILGYMIFVYWIFAGKVREGEGYHCDLGGSAHVLTALVDVPLAKSRSPS
jgi:cytochrome d ubiquinol oxidase subunit II